MQKVQIKYKVFNKNLCENFLTIVNKKLILNYLFDEALNFVNHNKTIKIHNNFLDPSSKTQIFKIKELKTIEFTITLVNLQTIQEINKSYRNKDYPTNVISFEEPILQNKKDIYIGDIYINPEVIKQEAIKENIVINNHYIHIMLHGFLHLLGFDHIKDKDAKIMEGIEIKTLEQFYIQNPYN